MDFTTLENKSYTQTIISLSHASTKLFPNNVGSFYSKDTEEFKSQDIIYLILINQMKLWLKFISRKLH